MPSIVSRCIVNVDVPGGVVSNHGSAAVPVALIIDSLPCARIGRALSWPGRSRASHELRDGLAALLTTDRADGPDVIGLVPRQEQHGIQDALLTMRPGARHCCLQP